MAGNVSPDEVSIDKVKDEIHALLCTFKGSVPSEQLLKDYKSLCGDVLPFRKLGFSNLNELLKNISDVVSCSYVDGNIFVRAIPRNESAHINKLVQGQKAPKKTPRTLQSYNSQRGKSGFSGNQFWKAGHLLKTPVHPNNLNKNGAQNRPAAPWNVPNVYQPPAMRSYVVIPSNSTVRQVMMPKTSQQPPSEQGTQTVRQHTSQPPPSLPKSSQQPAAAQKLPPAQQRPQLNIQLPGLPNIPSAVRPSKPTVPLLPVVRPNTFHRDKLQRFVQLHGLGDMTYEDSRLKNGKYVATVIIEKKKSSCYPDEYTLKDDAYEKAAEVALSEWESKYQDSIKKMAVTNDNNLMAKRVIDIVSKFPTGLWSEALAFDHYAKVYGESLPEDWVCRVQSVTKELEFTPVLENFLVCMAVKKTPEILPSSPSRSQEPFNQSISELLEQPTSKLVESHNHKRATPEEPVRPVQVQYTDSAFWMVNILVVHAGDKLAIRRIDSEQHTQWEEMTHDMELYYSEHQSQLSPVELLEPGRLYAAPFDGEWIRVELVSYPEEGKVELFLVDYADTEIVSISSVYPLEPRFWTLPCQGMICHLHGLTSFASSDVAVQAIIDRVLSNQFVAHIVSREPQLSVILYKSSSGREINMNEWILDQVAEKASPIPLKVGPVVQNSVISYVSSACDIYMLRDTPQQNAVHALVSLVALRAEDSPAPAILTTNSVYLGRSEKHGWCRMRLYSNIPTHDGNVSVQLMDFGDTELVPGNTLRDLQALSPVLVRLPDQAVRVYLARVPPSPSKVFTEKAAKTLRQIAPPELSLLVRVLEINNGVPVVELFERLESGKLVTINASLEMDESLYRSADQPSQSILPKARLDSDISQRVAAMTLPSRRSSSSSSPSPILKTERIEIAEADLPPVDNDRFLKPFNVHVFNASNPDHFYVQPLQTMPELGSLMHRLKEVCNQEEVKIAKMDAASVAVGGFYAAWHSKTESYRRVKVTGKGGGSIGIYFIDYGENDVIPSSGIRPLTSEFTELPAQAMKAKLFGVKPSDGDWSPQNAFFFKKFVEGRAFASYVMGVFPDKTLHLQLIDMSGKEDLVVSKYLVDSCHATSA